MCLFKALDTIKKPTCFCLQLLQDKLNELNFELKSVQEMSQRQDRTIQSLNEALKSKESKVIVLDGRGAVHQKVC